MNEPDFVTYGFQRMDVLIHHLNTAEQTDVRPLMDLVIRLSRATSTHNDPRMMEAVKLVCGNGYEDMLKSIKPRLYEAYSNRP